MANQYSKYTLKYIRAACKEFEEQNSFNGVYIHGHYKRQSLTNNQLASLIVDTYPYFDLFPVRNIECISTSLNGEEYELDIVNNDVVIYRAVVCVKLAEKLTTFPYGVTATHKYTTEKGERVAEIFMKENNGTWRSIHYFDESKIQRRKPHYDDAPDIAKLMGVEYTEEFDMKFQEVLDRFY